MPGVGARGPVGRAHPISKSEKPSTSRDKDYRAKGRDDKARPSLCNSLTWSLWLLVHIIICVGFSEYPDFDMEEIRKSLIQNPKQSLHFEGHSTMPVTSEVY